jgi:DNA-binding response OmpR family regulator
MPQRVLIVEDDLDTADGLSELVTLWGHEAAVAGSGAAARAAVAREPFDVVLLDLGLPDVDGVAIAAELRAALPPGATLVALSGHTDEALLARVRDAGAGALLRKPVDFDELQALLARGA